MQQPRIDFSHTYREAREKFIAASAAAGFTGTAHDCGETGPNGKPLYLDAVYAGAKDAPHLLILACGSNGIDGFAGSALMTAWLQTNPGNFLDTHRTAVLLLHAVNPYGFAWLRRSDRQNIVVSRNFLPFDSQIGDAELWAALEPAFTSVQWDDTAYRLMQIMLREAMASFGEDVVVEALTAGQSQRPSGFNYTGDSPTWSHRTIKKIINGYAAEKSRLTLLDIQTGTGAYGHAGVIAIPPGKTDESANAARQWGHFTRNADRDSADAWSPPGGLAQALHRWQPQKRINAGVLTFGTYGQDRVFRAMAADHWLHNFGAPLSVQGQALRLGNRDTLVPDTDIWHQSVIAEGFELIDLAIRKPVQIDS